MVAVVLFCVLLILVLLLADRFTSGKKGVADSSNGDQVRYLPDIMGRPKGLGSRELPSPATEGHEDASGVASSNFGVETGRNSVKENIPQEEPEEADGSFLDLDDEEEEWNGYGKTGNASEFASGVTFDELSEVESLLRQELPDRTDWINGAEIVRRVQGTDLFHLLENSMEGASQKIAALLDKRLSLDAESGSSFLRNGDLDGFDIGEFV